MSDLKHDPKTEAEQRGVMVVESNDRILQLDLDTAVSQALFKERFPKLREAYAEAERAQLVEFGDPPFATVSPGGNQHVYIRLAKPRPILERIVMQQFLGSDPTREVLSYARVLMQHPTPCVLFERPDVFEQVQSWLKGRP